MRKFSKVFALVYAIVLIVFTAYVLLDTFVITRVYGYVPDHSSGEYPNVDIETPSGNSNENGITEPYPIITDNLYLDDNITIALKEYREYGTTIYVADVRIKSAYFIKSAFANDAFGQNVTELTSKMAERHGAILAINGDYYGTRPRSYVLRNGIIYRDLSKRDQEDLVIYSNGSFGTLIEREVDIEDYITDGAIHVLAFGPVLVRDGEISVDKNYEVGISMESNPRTAIAMIEEGHYLFVVSDGRTKESAGLSLYELATFLQDRGAVIAYNLDGGGSSTMYFNGRIVNIPTTNGIDVEERSVSDIVYIGY